MKKEVKHRLNNKSADSLVLCMELWRQEWVMMNDK